MKLARFLRRVVSHVVQSPIGAAANAELHFTRGSPRGKAAPGRAVALHFDGRTSCRLPCGARSHGRIAELAPFASLSLLGQPR